MKRGIMALAVALEELDTRIEAPAEAERDELAEMAPVSDDAVDAAVASTSAEIDSTESDAAEIEEAEQISDVLDVYETQLGGEPVEEEPVVAEGEKAEGGGEAGPAEETGDAAPVGVEGEAPAAAAPATDGEAAPESVEGGGEAPAGTDAAPAEAAPADAAVAEVPAEGEAAPVEGGEEGRTEAAPEGAGERAEFVPPSEETLKAIEVAVEHFRVRLGYPKRVFPAMEAFATRPDAVRERALKNVQLLNRALKAELVVAEEGFIDRAINAIGRAFQTHMSLAKHIDASAVKIGAHGVNGKEFDDAAWARVFAASGKTEVSAGDIAGGLHKYNAEFHAKAMPILLHASRQISEVALAMSKSSFIAKGEEVEKIHGFNANLKELAAALGGLGIISTFDAVLGPLIETGVLHPVLDDWWQSFSGDDWGGWASCCKRCWPHRWWHGLDLCFLPAAGRRCGIAHSTCLR